MFPANLGKACLLSLLFLIIAYFQVFPQNSNTYRWETLYADNDLVLKISISQKKDSCGDGSVPTHRFAYLVETTEHLDYYISWKMNYLDCDGNLYCQERSFDMSKYDGSTYPIESSDYLITSSKIVIPFYDVQRSTYRRQSNKLLEIPYSTEPMSIDGATSIYYGKSTILTVRGGTLGTGANWFWYRDRCGGERIGNGTTITVEPRDTTNYYVRAEGKNNTTRCAAIRVAVDKRSRRPDAIGAQTSICRNEATRLTVMGGSLGPEADWIWYAGSCGGNRIGSGTSIFVTPNQTTTYFVRAEGRYNITDYAMSRIVVFEKSMDPKSVVVLGPATICEGESVKLVVTGGQLADGASWKWYAGDCTGIPIASGPEVQVSPSTTTTFLVRGEGLCNNTIPASIAITVKKKSTGALFINKSKEAYRFKKISLSVIGGNLGTGASWQWYKDGCGSGRTIGTGEAITIRPSRPATYFVRAIGPCNETLCASTDITPIKLHKWEKSFSGSYSKFLHAGFGIGPDWMHFVGTGRYATSRNGLATADGPARLAINGLGLKAEIPFYPFMKEYLSVGIIPSYAIGLSSSLFPTLLNLDSNSKGDENYLYQILQLENELAFGFKPVKFLFKHKLGILSNDYELKTASGSQDITTYILNGVVWRETISGGFRFGSYAGKVTAKRANNFDITYNLTRNHADRRFFFPIQEYGSLSTWDVGAGLSWWFQNAVKLQFDICLNTRQRDLDLQTYQLNRSTFQISFLINGNRFY